MSQATKIRHLKNDKNEIQSELEMTRSKLEEALKKIEEYETILNPPKPAFNENVSWFIHNGLPMYEMKKLPNSGRIHLFEIRQLSAALRKYFNIPMTPEQSKGSENLQLISDQIQKALEKPKWTGSEKISAVYYKVLPERIYGIVYYVTTRLLSNTTEWLLPIAPWLSLRAGGGECVGLVKASIHGYLLHLNQLPGDLYSKVLQATIVKKRKKSESNTDEKKNKKTIPTTLKSKPSEKVKEKVNEKTKEKTKEKKDEWDPETSDEESSASPPKKIKTDPVKPETKSKKVPIVKERKPDETETEPEDEEGEKETENKNAQDVKDVKIVKAEEEEEVIEEDTIPTTPSPNKKTKATPLKFQQKDLIMDSKIPISKPEGKKDFTSNISDPETSDDEILHEEPASSKGLNSMMMYV